jgi:hypothetical protein
VIRTAGFLLVIAALAAAEGAPHLARVMPPAGRVSVSHAIEQGVRFLVANQNEDGSFGRHAVGRVRELWCHVPGGHQAFRAATTALCWLGLHGAPYQSEASRRAQERCLAWLVAHARVKRAFPQQFYNVWSFGYGLRALARALDDKAPGASPEAIRATARSILEALEIYQSPDGGWGYLDFRVPAYKPSWSTPFTTATVMIALDEARGAGLEVPQAMIDRATRLLWRCRTPDGNYLYSIDWKWRPAGAINRPAGSSMRNQPCNLALHLFDDDLGVPGLRRGLEQLVDNHRFAAAGLRRPRPHESWYGVSGYFYLYGQHYASLVLERMPGPDRRRFWPEVVRAVLKTRQPDGSFWDYPTYGYHKFYGTGYALIALGRCPGEVAKILVP